MYGTITAVDGLKLHKAPDPKSVVLDLMAKDDKVEIMFSATAKAGWTRVAWLPARGARLEGWASAKYIRIEAGVPKKPAPQLIPEPEPASALGLVFIALIVALAGVALWGLAGMWGWL